MIEGELADSVDVFRVGESKDRVLSWRRGVGIKNFHRGHAPIIPSTCGGRTLAVRSQRVCADRSAEERLEALQVGADFGIGPVRIAYELATNDTLAVDDVRFRPAFGVVELCGSLVGVAHGDQVDMATLDEARVGIGVVVDADGKYGQVGAIVMKFEKAGHLLNAGSAL